MSDDLQSYLDSGGSQAPSDPQTYLDSGGAATHPLSSPEVYDPEGETANALAGGTEGLAQAASGGAAMLGGGLTYLGTLAGTRGDTAAAKAVQEETNKALTYKPRTAAGEAVGAGIGEGASYLGERYREPAGRAVFNATGSPALAAAAETAVSTPQFLLPKMVGKVADVARTRLSSTGAPVSEPMTTTPAEAPKAAAITPETAPELGIKDERAEAGKPVEPATDAQQAARLALAKRVGLKEVRRSAIEGDPQAAADDYDAQKYTGDPIGERLRGVIKGEQQALTQHAEGIVDDAGGTPEATQTNALSTGRQIAAPFDALREHIDAQTNALYKDADAKLGATPVDTGPLDAALEDKTLKNSLMAQGKSNFLDGIKAQLQNFKENNGGAMTAKTMEQFRQFVNTLYSTDKNAVGKIVGGVDDSMGQAVGDSAYEAARQSHQLKKTLLDNPEGVSQLFDKEPGTINRSTPLEDIPDKLSTMDANQFKNVWNTLKTMPEELQPQASAAMDAIRAHMGNRVLKAGTSTAEQWNKKAVNKEFDTNSENYKTAFADTPELTAKLKDLRDAGEMLRLNTRYRGAHAQASNMVRKGIGVAAEAGGAAMGGTAGGIIAGPTGAGIGTLAGKAAGAKVRGALDARAARAEAESRVIKVP